jgi:hypothetical protein
MKFHALETNSPTAEAANALKFRRMDELANEDAENANARAPTAIDRASMAT